MSAEGRRAERRGRKEEEAAGVVWVLAGLWNPLRKGPGDSVPRPLFLCLVTCQSIVTLPAHLRQLCDLESLTNKACQLEIRNTVKVMPSTMATTIAPTATATSSILFSTESHSLSLCCYMSWGVIWFWQLRSATSSASHQQGLGQRTMHAADILGQVHSKGGQKNAGYYCKEQHPTIEIIGSIVDIDRDVIAELQDR